MTDTDADAGGEEELDAEELDESPEEGEEAETEDGDGGGEAEAAEPEGEAEADPDAAPERPPARRSNDTIRALRRRAQEAERERDEFRRRATEPPAPQKTPAQQAAEDQAERERVSLLAPEDQIAHWRNKDRNDFSNALRGLAMQQADQADQSKFDRSCERKPHFAAIADEVEKGIQEARRNGNFSVTREAMAFYLIGKRADARAARARGQQTRRGEEARARQTVRATRGRSDVGAERRPGGNDASARAKRLENELI